MSIIGKSYQAFDNSYSLCLSKNAIDQRDRVYFAGTHNGLEPIIATIHSEPYFQLISNHNGLKSVAFVNLIHEDQIYRVMYFEKCVIG